MSENVACSKLFIFMLCNVQAKDNYCKPFFSQLNKFELGDYYLLKFHSYVYTWLKIWHKMIFLQKGGLVTCKVLYCFFRQNWSMLKHLMYPNYVAQWKSKTSFSKKIYCMYHSRLRIVMYNGDLFCVCHKEKRRHRMIWC